jgi:tRNA(Ile)-lysidine synthase
MMKNHLKNRFLEFSLKKNLFQEGDNVLVAVSGGADSVVLLDLLITWQKRLGLTLGVVHLNHKLRGKDAEKDKVFVENLAKYRLLSFYSLQGSVKKYAKEKQLSLEEAGHLLRKHLFEDLADKQGYQKIATGHHADDQAETVFMRLINGTGLQGLTGIRLISGQWVRPLLFAKRNEILEYAYLHKIDYRTDKTNLDITIGRNRIRHELLPLIEREYNAKITQHLNHLSQILTEWDEYISRNVQEIYQSRLNYTFENKIQVELAVFRFYFSWILIDLCERILSDLTQQDFKIGFHQFSDFLKWIEKSQIGSTFTWRKNLKSIKQNNYVLFYREIADRSREEQIKIFPEKEYLLPGTRIKFSLFKVLPGHVSFIPDKDTEFINGVNLEFPLIVRNWKAGDYFVPLGLKHQKLVSDYLTDQKIGLPEKKEVKVLENKGEIVAILGLQIDDRYRVKEDSSFIFCLKLKRIEHERS